MYFIQPLPEQLDNIAKAELNETIERIPKDLKALKEWLNQQSHLKVRQDDQFLIQFLRGCKYSLERCKEKLDLYHTLKAKYPELLNLTNTDDTNFRQSYRLGAVSILPEPLNGNGPRISIIRYSKVDLQSTIEQFWQSILSVYEILLIEDPYACINGIIIIGDYADCTASHILRFTPGIMKKISSFVEMCLPLRLKGMILINTGPALNQFFNMTLPLFSQKLRARTIILGKDHTKLYERIPKKYLPKEYDGEQHTIQGLVDEFENKFDKYRDYFKANAEYGANEKLRVGQAIDFDAMYGMGGSFRKLEVD